MKSKVGKADHDEPREDEGTGQESSAVVVNQITATPNPEKETATEVAGHVSKLGEGTAEGLTRSGETSSLKDADPDRDFQLVKHRK